MNRAGLPSSKGKATIGRSGPGCANIVDAPTPRRPAHQDRAIERYPPRPRRGTGLSVAEPPWIGRREQPSAKPTRRPPSPSARRPRMRRRRHRPKPGPGRRQRASPHRAPRTPAPLQLPRRSSRIRSTHTCRPEHIHGRLSRRMDLVRTRALCAHVDVAPLTVQAADQRLLQAVRTRSVGRSPSEFRRAPR